MSPGFPAAYTRLGPKEGGYANNPADAGGETWKGVARNRWPDWPGWHLVDDMRHHAEFPNILAEIPELEEAVQAFYREHFWAPILGDQLPQEVADELFEASVNCGVINGVRFLQTALNVLNRNNALYLDVDVDGKMGGQTLGAVQSCLSTRGVKRLVQFMNHVQGNYYMDLLIRKPDQEVFVLSWFSRVEV